MQTENTPLLSGSESAENRSSQKWLLITITVPATLLLLAGVSMSLTAEVPEAGASTQEAVTAPMIWTSTSLDYVRLTCNWYLSVKSFIGEDEARRSVFIFLDSDDDATKQQAQSCGVDANYVGRFEWEQQGGAPLGAAYASQEYAKMVFQKVMQTKHANTLARAQGRRFAIFNDGDTAWLHDLRQVLPECFDNLVVTQLEVRADEDYNTAMSLMSNPMCQLSPYGSVLASNSDVKLGPADVCVGVMVFNVVHPSIGDFTDAWMRLAMSFHENPPNKVIATMADQSAFNSLARGAWRNQVMVFSPMVVPNGWLIQNYTFAKFNPTAMIVHANWIKGEAKKVEHLKSWGQWRLP